MASSSPAASSSAPLLSLCVPTYNRASLLRESLRAILSQITPEMAGAVEVVVLDNASPDETPQVVQQAQADFPHVFLRYVQRPENIGADANFCTAPAEAAGEFVYLLSDDDVLLPGAVAKLLELIRKHPGIDAIALNVRAFVDDPFHDLGKPPAYALPEDVLLTGRDAALSLLRMHLTFLSCIAFRRATVAGRDYSGRYGTVLAQAFLFLDALAPGGGLYAVARPYLARRDDNSGGYDFFQVFITNFHPVLEYARALGYSPQAVQDLLSHHLDFLYYMMLTFKEQGGYGRLKLSDAGCAAVCLRLLRAYGLNRFVVLRLIPRLLVPRSVFAPVQKLYTRWKPRPASPRSQKVQ